MEGCYETTFDMANRILRNPFVDHVCDASVHEKRYKSFDENVRPVYQSNTTTVLIGLLRRANGYKMVGAGMT